MGGSHNLHPPSPILQGYAYAKNWLQFSYSRIQLIEEIMKQIIIFFYLFNPSILNDTKDIFSLGPICDQKLTFY